MPDFIGTANDDILTGGAGDDFLDGQFGDDTLTGGQGNDSLDGGAGADVYVFSAGDGVDEIENFDPSDNGAVDRLQFTDLNSTDATITRAASTGDEREDLVISFAGGDTVTVLNGLSDLADSFLHFVDFQGDGVTFDTDTLRQTAIAADETAGADTITGFASDDTIFGGSGADSLIGGNGGDIIYGGADSDQIDGQSGNDFLYGGTGDDTIIAGTGADTIFFGTGDGSDLVDISDLFDNGAVDTLVFTDYSSTDATIVRLAETGAGSDDLLISFVNGDSVQINDALSSNNDNFIHFVEFIGDAATLDTQALRADVLADSATAGDDTFVGFGSSDTLSGQAGDDSIAGLAGNDILYGGTGNDTLEGDSGADTYFFATGDGVDLIRENDIFDNGAVDRAVFTDRSSTDVTVTRVASSGAGSDDVVLSFTNGDQVTWADGLQSNNDRQITSADFVGDGVSLDITTLRLAVLALDSTAGDDTSQGFGSDDVLIGLAGNDILIGVSGNDVMYGGAGNDSLFGGSGADSYFFDTGDGVDTIQENDIFDNGAEDRVIFTDRSSTDATLGVAAPSGPGADDLIISFTNGDQVTFINALSTNNDLQVSFVDFLLDGISLSTQDLRDTIISQNSTSGNDTISGFDIADTIDGLAGDDVIFGLNGNDVLTGGTGNDTLDGANGADTYRFASGDGQDVIVENDIFDNGAVDRIVFTDRVIADATFSRVASTGNASDDLVISFANGDSVTYANALSTNLDTFLHFVDFTDGSLDTQDLRDIILALDQTAGDDESQGFGTNDQMIGLAGDDLLIGIQGDDTFDGGTGNDTLIGGAGADTYLFEQGDGQDLIENNDLFDNGAVDRLTFTDYALADATFAKVANTGTDSRDLVISFANGDQVRVNDGVSPFIDGFLHFVDFTDATLDTLQMRQAVIDDQTSAGDDTVFGFEDNIADTIEAGTGNDTLNGLNGNDIYVYNPGDGDDVIVEANSAGSDTLSLNGISLADVIFDRRTGPDGFDDLVISFNGQTGSVTVRDGLVPLGAKLDAITDGTSTITIDPLTVGIPLRQPAPAGPDELIVYSNDFETDANGFSDTTRTDGNAVLTTFLGQFGGTAGLEDVTATFVIPAGATQAVIDFDFLELDSWDASETLNVFIDGIEVISETFSGINFNDPAVTGTVGDVSFTIDPVSDSANTLGFATNFGDQVHHVQLVVNNPAATVTLGLGTTLNSAISDESWGIDNVRVAALATFDPAAPIVTTLVDENDGSFAIGDVSLREAILNADDSATITFETGLTGTIRLSTLGELDITQNVTIDGGGLITITGDVADDDVVAASSDLTDVVNSFIATGLLDDNTRIFNAQNATATTTLTGLTLTGGHTDAADENGGAVLAAGDLVLTDMTFTGNGTSGGSSTGGAVHADGTLTITDSTFNANATFANDSGGGAIHAAATLLLSDSIVENNRTNGDRSDGGGVRVVGTATITGTDVTGNLTQGSNAEGGGVYTINTLTFRNGEVSGNLAAGINSDGGGIFAGGDLTVVNATVDGNRTTEISADGGGLYGNAEATIVSSTISNNGTAGDSGQGGGVFANQTLTILNSTISRNTTSGDNAEGGGVFGEATVEIISSTINGNATSGSGSEGSGVYGTAVTFTNSISLGNYETTPGANDAGIALASGGLLYANGGGLLGANAANVFAQIAEVLADTTGDGIADTGTGIYAGVLADNGGSVATINLLNTGLAVNGGSLSFPVSLPADTFDLDGDGNTFEPLPIDSRGSERVSGTAIDLGAVELLSIEGTFNAESLDGTAADDLIALFSGDDTATGGEGADNIDGNAGADLIFGDDGDDSLGGGLGTDAILGGAGNDTLDGGGEADILVGSEGDDIIYGGDGDDDLEGAAGADAIFGGAGFDTANHFLAASGVTADLSDPTNNTGDAAGDSYNSVEALRGAPGFANTLTGDANDNALTGGDLGDLLQGDAGNDTLDGGLGDDTMEGGEGDDIYIVDSASDVVTELAGEGVDIVETSVAITAPDHVDQVRLTAAGSLDLIANATGTWLIGNEGANSLTGAAGDDRLQGEGGDDTLTGLGGNDLHEGGAGADTFVFTGDDGINTILDFEVGTDLIDISATGQDFSSILLTDTAAGVVVTYDFVGAPGQVLLTGLSTVDLSAGDFIEGISAAPPPIVGTTGDDNLFGTHLSDELQGGEGNDLINGLTGADIMSGGLGDDRIFVDDVGDIVIENAGEGYDRVYTTISLTLGDNIEAGAGLGTADISIFGNAEANWISGNSGNNLLSGGANNDRLIGLGGDDLLIGGTGNDVLQGSSGFDTFIFTEGDDLDLILDYSVADDLIRFEGVIEFADLTISQNGANVLIDYGNDLISILNANASDFVESEFEFLFLDAD